MCAGSYSKQQIGWVGIEPVLIPTNKSLNEIDPYAVITFSARRNFPFRIWMVKLYNEARLALTVSTVPYPLHSIARQC